MEVIEASKIAIEYLVNFYQSQGSKLKNILVEEVEQNDYKSNHCWFITIGFNLSKKKPNSSEISKKDLYTKIFTEALEEYDKELYSSKRKYKTVIINSKGIVLAMKMKVNPLEESTF